jgi:hypothetical protein
MFSRSIIKNNNIASFGIKLIVCMVSRVCTLSMKIFVTNAFLSDWFAQKQSIGKLGHYV